MLHNLSKELEQVGEGESILVKSCEWDCVDQ